MPDISLNKDETESWESSIDKDSEPKLKYPIKLVNSLESVDLDNMLEMEIKMPKNKCKTVTKVVDIKKNKKVNKGLF